MKKARLIGGVAALCAFAGAAFVSTGGPARGFDLRSAPLTVKHPSADITDTYFFPSPSNPNNVVAVMDVEPGIPSSASAATALQTFFEQGVLYTMKFDNRYTQEATTARPVENFVLQFSFSALSGTTGNQSQTVTVYGPGVPTAVGTRTPLINGATASGAGFVNRPFSVASGQVQVFAGARRDPQFFNATLFNQIFPDRNGGSTAASCLASTCPTGFNSGSNDTFANSNVLSIVVEMPKTLVGGGNNNVVAYWATTSTSNGQ